MSRVYVSLIQSDFGRSHYGNFEAVIVEGEQLWHWSRDNNDVHLPWIRGQRITGDHDDVAGPGCIIQSTPTAGQRGRFEVVVPLRLYDGSIELRHFFQNNSDVPGRWTKAQFITQSCAGLGGVIQSRFGSARHGDFEVLVDEHRGSVVHYWHQNSRAEEVWIRTDRIVRIGPSSPRS